jgi:putative hydrolase of the HAD superfamily
VTQAVLLDAYGTLVEPDWRRLTDGRDAIADRAGVDRAAAHDAWAATHEARMLGVFGSLVGDLRAVLAVAGPAAAPIDDGMLAELANLERANWAAGVRVYPDVLPTLERLRATGLRMAIVTNASAEAAAVIPAHGLDQRVELVLASCELGALKPELLAIALERLGVRPDEVTLVDDDHGQVAAARRMGIHAVLVRRGSTDTSPAGDDVGDAEVTDLREIPALIAARRTEPPR